MPAAPIWNLPSASGRQGESTTLAIRSAPRPLRRANLQPFAISPEARDSTLNASAPCGTGMSHNVAADGLLLIALHSWRVVDRGDDLIRDDDGDTKLHPIKISFVAQSIDVRERAHLIGQAQQAA